MPQYPTFAFLKGYATVFLENNTVNIEFYNERTDEQVIRVSYLKGTYEFKQFVSWLRNPISVQLRDDIKVTANRKKGVSYVKMSKISWQGKHLLTYELQITDKDAEDFVMQCLDIFGN